MTTVVLIALHISSIKITGSNVRERFRKIVKENVMWDIEERFGDLKGAINKFNREAKWIGYTKFVLYMIALSGWAVAAVLFLMR